MTVVIIFSRKKERDFVEQLKKKKKEEGIRNAIFMFRSIKERKSTGRKQGLTLGASSIPQKLWTARTHTETRTHNTNV